MALFQREDRSTRTEEGTVPLPQTPAPPAPAAETPSRPGEFQTQLGKGSRIEGRLSFEGSVRIEGQVEGEIHAQETVFIGEQASINAQIHGNSIVIVGRVTGDVTAKKRVELRAPAKLVGNIHTPSLVINEGVTFEGHCSMGAAESRTEKDRKVAIFPKEKEERVPAPNARASSDAAS